MATSYYGQGSTPSRSSDLKSSAYKEQYNHEADTLLIQAKLANEAAKVVVKEQKNIQRKMKKEHSKKLKKCIEKYNNAITEIKDAFARIGKIVNSDKEGYGFTDQSRVLGKRRPVSLKEKKGQKRSRVEETFTDHRSECFKCLNKERQIEQLQENINELQNSLEKNRKDHEYDLKQVIRSKDELEKQYLAEKQHLQRKYEEEMQAKEEALKRLSSIASSKLRDKNPNITDLSDQNRPTKIAEKMSELYDNQWTDAFDVLEGKMDERQVIQTLLDTLMRVSRECRRLSEENFFERVQRSIESPIEATGMPKTTLLLSDQLKQQIKEFRKIRAAAVVKDVEKIIKSRILLPNHPATEVQDYLSRCVEIGWFCAVQDPPLILSAQSPVEFDTNTFKDYTKRGKYVEYVVWPAMYLHEGGALLAKGIAQGSDHKPTSTRGYAEYTQAPLQKTSVQAAPAARITSRNQAGQRHHPPLTLPDQQRQNIHLQSDGFSSGKVRIPGNTQKSQTVYSTRRTTEMNANQTVYGRRGYAVGTASHSTDF